MGNMEAEERKEEGTPSGETLEAAFGKLDEQNLWNRTCFGTKRYYERVLSTGIYPPTGVYGMESNRTNHENKINGTTDSKLKRFQKLSDCNSYFI